MTKPEPSTNLAPHDHLLATALGQPDPQAVFPWQHALFAAMTRGDLPSALDLPTGLGKTSVMAIWLVARALGAPVPRRLVYVVDRRAVVDQATQEAERLRQWVHDHPEHRQTLGLESGFLPISTLRGQHVDNREWLEDPSKPAIIVGTVDMIGSRLLFEGYGTSRKMRPYHAALLACDTLFVIDEAHIIPAFEALIAAIPSNASLHATNVANDAPPRMRVMALSATQRADSSLALTYSEHDLAHEIVAKRLYAQKRLRILPAAAKSSLRDELVSATWNLFEELRASFTTCIVFCDRRDTAEYVARELERLGKKDHAEVELFVGARRVGERQIAEKRLSEMGFLAGAPAPEAKHPRFLVATSAAEVGVDLDAEHLVCDVVAWERMVQRFGRVNRRGARPAHVRIVATPSDFIKKHLDSKKSAADEETETQGPAAASAERYRTTLELLEKLPGLETDTHDASPLTLRQIAAANPALVKIATTPAPLHPALDRATLDAWAMTSLEQHPARPIVAPWLRGWVEDEPQVTLVWRRFLLPPDDQDLWSDATIKSFVEAAPPQTIETLEIDVKRALAWLRERAGAIVEKNKTEPRRFSWHSTIALVLNAAGEFVRKLELKDLVTDEKLAAIVPGGIKTIRHNASRLERDDLPDATLLLDARLGGLQNGLLADESHEAVGATADDDAPWLEVDDAGTPIVRFRMRLRDAKPTEDPDWPERLRLPWKRDGEKVSLWLVIQKWRHDATTEDDRSAGREQLLAEHQACTADHAVRLGKRLALADRMVALLRMAARMHDEGKRAARWQRAMHAKKDGVYAKTRGPVNPSVLDGYRHELGSLSYVEKAPDFLSLPPDEQDLVLHLVAAHHGYARPLISTSGVDDQPPSLLPERAQAVALRYFRLSERWGPWGLAYWESLLRAADQQASRENDAKGAR